MQITIKRCKAGRCSEDYQQVWIDGKIVFEGDAYHNKISDKINGFLLCLDYLKNEYTITYESILCTFGCD